ncbi:MAG: hypothetical protein OXC69_10155 [Candidatus Tectomicrobia bacterium]|nr:hypothetical protein [Candidatus Tectomicrobia bacterium]
MPQGIPIALLPAYASRCLKSFEETLSDEGGTFVFDAALVESRYVNEKRCGEAALIPSVSLDHRDSK